MLWIIGGLAVVVVAGYVALRLVRSAKPISTGGGGGSGGTFNGGGQEQS